MASSPQSLAEAARKEAERRKALEQQGIPEKVIDGQDPARLGPNGNLTLFSPANTVHASVRSQPVRTAGTLDRFRSALEKLDREIRQAQDRLAALRDRAAAVHRAPPTPKRGSRKASGNSDEDRLRWQIREWEGKLERVKQERSETYDNGRKAGFLPGELDGRGIIP